MVKMLAVVVLFLFALKSATTIRLDGNGYTDILVVINPTVPENEELLNQIKKMITSGSEYLFEALDNKVFFKEVKILVPPTWTSGKYEKATTETYKKVKAFCREEEHNLEAPNEQNKQCGKATRTVMKCIIMKEALRMNDGETLGKEIIFLTDGEATDNVLDCLQESVKSGAIIHTVALGPNADNTLRTMAVQTEGMFHIASEILSSNDLVDAFASKITWDGNPCKQPVQLESTGKRVEDWFNGTVSIGRTVGNRTTFTLLYERSAPTVYIQSPSGLVYDQRHTTNNANTITFTVPGTAEVGEWKYSFFNNETSAQETSLLVMSWAVSEDIPPITVTIRMNQQTSDGTKPMVVLAAVRQNYNPVLGASVWVHLESDTGNSSKFQLLDNGAGCDVFRDDGIYSRYFTELRCGKYSLKVKVEYQHGADQFSFYRHSGALYVPGYVVDGKYFLAVSHHIMQRLSINGDGEKMVLLPCMNVGNMAAVPVPSPHHQKAMPLTLPRDVLQSTATLQQKSPSTSAQRLGMGENRHLSGGVNSRSTLLRLFGSRRPVC
ncbi:epithelial chloride channel protein-like isoform X2 [Silurus meridionalis]|nr:epithelial chloride channel protein-like isoform X2 [Silurus meridionalis]